MELKNARLARAENLSDNIKESIRRESGLVIIEAKNPDLREEITPIGDGGIREYLLSLGEFSDADLTK